MREIDADAHLIAVVVLYLRVVVLKAVLDVGFLRGFC
jgi:hypothetical protein